MPEFGRQAATERNAVNIKLPDWLVSRIRNETNQGSNNKGSKGASRSPLGHYPHSREMNNNTKAGNKSTTQFFDQDR